MKKKKAARGNKVAVTFEMPADIQADELCVAGDFNAWDPAANPMKKLKSGSWSTTINLAPGTYRYRYVANGTQWYNDPHADRYEPSGMGEDNSVVLVDEVG